MFKQIRSSAALIVATLSFTTFTARGAAALIDPSTLSVTASTSYTNRGPEYALNGAGLADIGAHDSDGANYKMWMNNNTGVSWMRVDLAKVCKLVEIKFWNFNWMGYTNRGVKDVDVYCSTAADPAGSTTPDEGVWTKVGSTTVNQATGNADYAGDAPYVLDTPTKTRWVLLVFRSNQGGGSYYGLSEVQFFEAAGPSLEDARIARGGTGAFELSGTIGGEDVVSVKALVYSSDEALPTTNELAGAMSKGSSLAEELTGIAPNASCRVDVLLEGVSETAEIPMGTIYNGEVTIKSGENADANFGKKGTFIVSRDDSDAAVAYPLTVRYAVGAEGTTAVAGTDYVALSGEVTIPAGAANATITVMPTANLGAKEAVSLALGLAEGVYAISSEAATATISLEPLTSSWTYDATAKTISDGTWVFNVNESNGKLKIASRTSVVEGATSLNFVKPVLDAGNTIWPIYEIADNVLKDNKTLSTLTLPETIVKIGNSAFQGCPIEGDFVLGYGDAGDLTIGNYAFNGHKFTTVDLGPRFKRFGMYAMQSENTTLLSVKVPDTMTKWESGTFYGCSALTNITPCLPRGLTSTQHSMLAGIPNVRGTLEFCCGETAYGAGQNTACNSGFDAIRFGKKFTGVFASNNSFSGMTNLKDIFVEGDNTFDFKGTYAFMGHTDFGIVVHLPDLRKNPNWKAVTEDPQQVTPWARLDAETKAKFAEHFPGCAHPKGLIVSKWSSNDKNAEKDSLKNCWITWPGNPGLSLIVR